MTNQSTAAAPLAFDPARYEQTLAIARRLGPSGRVLATDIAPNILKVARRAAGKAAEIFARIQGADFTGAWRLI